jgi:hypothetical protein
VLSKIWTLSWESEIAPSGFAPCIRVESYDLALVEGGTECQVAYHIESSQTLPLDLIAHQQQAYMHYPSRFAFSFVGLNHSATDCILGNSIPILRPLVNDVRFAKPPEDNRSRLGLAKRTGAVLTACLSSPASIYARARHYRVMVGLQRPTINRLGREQRLFEWIAR